MALRWNLFCNLHSRAVAPDAYDNYFWHPKVGQGLRVALHPKKNIKLQKSILFCNLNI